MNDPGAVAAMAAGKPQCSQGNRAMSLWQDKLAKAIAFDHDLPFLDMYGLFRERGDLHPIHGLGEEDCAHYCYTTESFAPVLHLLHHSLTCQASCFG